MRTKLPKIPGFTIKDFAVFSNGKILNSIYLPPDKNLINQQDGLTPECLHKEYTAGINMNYIIGKLHPNQR
jgi:hypothetical protein